MQRSKQVGISVDDASWASFLYFAFGNITRSPRLSQSKTPKISNARFLNDDVFKELRNLRIEKDALLDSLGEMEDGHTTNRNHNESRLFGFLFPLLGFVHFQCRILRARISASTSTSGVLTRLGG